MIALKCEKDFCRQPGSPLEGKIVIYKHSEHREIQVAREGTKRELRMQYKVAMLTKLKADMKRQCDYAEEGPLHCRQGQELQWGGYDEQDGYHYFIPPPPAPLCSSCWEQSGYPKQFSIPANTHTFFGTIPLNTSLAQRLLHSVRSWIEPAQSFEKSQLGLKMMFLNSLRLCWLVSLIADSATLLRLLALLKDSPPPDPCSNLFSQLKSNFRSNKPVFESFAFCQ